MSWKKTHNTEKLTNKKQTYCAKNTNTPKQTKEAINILSNMRTNIYQRIYYLITSPVETWKQFDFLSSESKVASFIEKLEKEIKLVKNNDFNFAKYKTAIFCILGKDVEKFTKAIIKNMYIAKLQNIVFLIKETAENEGIKEAKNTNKDIMR